MPVHTLELPKLEEKLDSKSMADENGFAQERLARMHAAMQRHVTGGWTPGLATFIHHRGKQHVDAIGTMAFDSNVPMSRDTIFRLASMTNRLRQQAQ